MESIRGVQPTITSKLQRWIDEGKTYREIVDTLKVEFPNVTRGLSVRSLRRFCRNNSVQKQRGTDLDSVVAECIDVVSDCVYLYTQLDMHALHNVFMYM